VKKALLSLALAVFAVGVAQAAEPSASPLVATSKTFYIAEAYPGNSQPYVGAFAKDCSGNTISDNNKWTDTAPDGADNVDAVPGILCISNPRTFQTVPAWCVTAPRIQSIRFTKAIPLSLKCPGGYKGDVMRQFGVTNIRTWWALLYTAPGTTFTLEITSVCEDAFRRAVIYKDIYRWVVTASFESTRNALKAMRLHPIGFTETPCIVAFRHFNDLLSGLTNLERLVAQIRDTSLPQNVRDERRVQAQDLLFTLEAICVGTTAFTDCFIPEEVFSQQFPPSDEVQLGDMGFTAFLDTIENPCCCKILVDLEYLGNTCGIASP